MRFSRGLFGKPPNPAFIEKLLRDLSLWDKKDSRIMTLSGGMKRRLMIAKALSHEPRILFLDEPTAGVDVELRRDMWAMVRALRETGVTIILTTHYIEEAEEMADRVGVINNGEIILVEDKADLDAQARQEATDARPARAGWSAFPTNSRRFNLDSRRTAANSSTPSTREAERDRHRAPCCAGSPNFEIDFQGSATRSKVRSKRSSSAWSRKQP